MIWEDLKKEKHWLKSVGVVNALQFDLCEWKMILCLEVKVIYHSNLIKEAFYIIILIKAGKIW